MVNKVLFEQQYLLGSPFYLAAAHAVSVLALTHSQVSLIALAQLSIGTHQPLEHTSLSHPAFLQKSQTRLAVSGGWEGGGTTYMLHNRDVALEWAAF